MTDNKAYFITFEGIDGSGKSTQVRMLVENLSKQGIKVLGTCEPQKGGEVRKLLVEGKGTFTPEQEAEMMFQDRQDHLQNKVLPALARGEWVISDRFADSSRTFQGYAMGVDMSYIDKLYSTYVGDFAPDLTIVLDMEPKKSFERALERNKQENSQDGKYEAFGLAFQEKVRAGYLDIAKNNPSRCVIIDASSGIDEVQQKILKVIENRFLQPKPVAKQACKIG